MTGSPSVPPWLLSACDPLLGRWRPSRDFLWTAAPPGTAPHRPPSPPPPTGNCKRRRGVGDAAAASPPRLSAPSGDATLLALLGLGRCVTFRFLDSVIRLACKYLVLESKGGAGECWGASLKENWAATDSTRKVTHAASSPSLHMVHLNGLSWPEAGQAPLPLHPRASPTP
ncbi:hypothetical protein E2C01_006083 [Portunus trituberculatus]|uniref:Uncharacterized protein n=1 Tax=Portunus trituberculatus TaxID=210409 RepID=A0A5B7CUB4_PORTR|nr:hypothetical protein [Portunus trituberculatus]